MRPRQAAAGEGESARRTVPTLARRERAHARAPSLTLSRNALTIPSLAVPQPCPSSPTPRPEEKKTSADETEESRRRAVPQTATVPDFSDGGRFSTPEKGLCPGGKETRLCPGAAHLRCQVARSSRIRTELRPRPSPPPCLRCHSSYAICPGRLAARRPKRLWKKERRLKAESGKAKKTQNKTEAWPEALGRGPADARRQPRAVKRVGPPLPAPPRERGRRPGYHA